MTQVKQQRYYALDWLRVLAFSLLIFYHLGMYYVADWGWHIKSEHQLFWLQDFMVWANQWRMSLLFFLSGLSLLLAFRSNVAAKLIGLRGNRLLIPLLFGMFVVVPPQTYFEAITSLNIQESYWQFWLYYINPTTDYYADHHGSIGLLTWNHLWFLPYIFVYSALLLLMLKMLSRDWLTLLKFKHFITSLVFCWILLVVARLFLRNSFPTTHALFDDWYNHAVYFTLFCFGGVLALNMVWLDFIKLHRRRFLLAGVIGYSFIFADRHGYTGWLAANYEHYLVIQVFYSLMMMANVLAWIMTCCGYASRYLAFNNRFLNYANNAVLPWYILHQTLIIVAAAWLTQFALPAYLDALCILLFTLIACFCGYEVVKRITILRWLFGLKVKFKKTNKKLKHPF